MLLHYASQRSQDVAPVVSGSSRSISKLLRSTSTIVVVRRCRRGMVNVLEHEFVAYKMSAVFRFVRKNHSDILSVRNELFLSIIG